MHQIAKRQGVCGVGGAGVIGVAIGKWAIGGVTTSECFVGRNWVAGQADRVAGADQLA